LAITSDLHIVHKGIILGKQKLNDGSFRRQVSAFTSKINPSG
jgi:hypothetical protein